MMLFTFVHYKTFVKLSSLGSVDEVLYAIDHDLSLDEQQVVFDHLSNQF